MKNQNADLSISIISTVLLLSAIIFDYAYYLKLGVGFSSLPISYADMFHTILNSIPLLAILLISNIIFEFIYRKTENGLTEKELLKRINSSKHPKICRIYHFGYINLFRWIFLLIPVLYILLGDQYIAINGHPLILGVGCILWWNKIYLWISSYSRFETNVPETLKSFLKYAPLFLFFFFAYGYSQSIIDLQIAMSEKSATKVEFLNKQQYPVLRIIDKGSLIYYNKTRTIEFVPFDKDQKIIVNKCVKSFKGLLHFLKPY